MKRYYYQWRANALERKARRLLAQIPEFEEKLAQNPHVALKYRTYWKGRIRKLGNQAKRLQQKARQYRAAS